MRQFSILKAIPFSLFSAELYRDVGRNWKGLGFTYLFVILLIGVIISSFYFAYRIKQIDSDELSVKAFDSMAMALSPDKPFSLENQLNRAIDVLSQVPLFTLENGKGILDEHSPYTIIDPKTNRPLVIFDTSGEYTSLMDTEAFVLVTDDSIITKDNNGNEKRKYFSSIQRRNEKPLNDFISVISQIPKIRITGGVAYTEVQKPYIIKDDYSDNVLLAIDTNGILSDTDARFVLTKTEFLYPSNEQEGERKSFQLSDINEYNFIRGIAFAIKSIKKLGKMAILVSSPVVLIFFFVVDIFLALLFGGIGLIFAKIYKCNLEYEDTVRLACVAFTAEHTLDIIMLMTSSADDIFSKGTGISFIMSMAIILAYMFYAVSSNSQKGIHSVN